MRQYEGGGRRGPWMFEAPADRVPFQRTDGTVMTEEEIKKVATVDQVDAAKLDAARKQAARARREENGHSRVRHPDTVYEHTLRLVALYGRAQAARILDLTTGGLNSRIETARSRGLNTPTFTEAREAATPEELAHIPIAPEPDAEPDLADAVRDETMSHVAAGEELAPMGAADMAAFLKGASESTQQPVVAIVSHFDGEARANAWSDGYDQAVADREVSSAIDTLIDWLAMHGPSWTDSEAERWLKAFTATIDLVYPTKAAA